jgi:hypothetical protein
MFRRLCICFIFVGIEQCYRKFIQYRNKYFNRSQLASASVKLNDTHAQPVLGGCCKSARARAYIVVDASVVVVVVAAHFLFHITFASYTPTPIPSSISQPCMFTDTTRLFRISLNQSIESNCTACSNDPTTTITQSQAITSVILNHQLYDFVSFAILVSDLPSACTAATTGSACGIPPLPLLDTSTSYLFCDTDGRSDFEVTFDAVRTQQSATLL